MPMGRGRGLRVPCTNPAHSPVPVFSLVLLKLLPPYMCTQKFMWLKTKQDQD